MRVVNIGDVTEITSGFAFQSVLFTKDESQMPLIRIRDVVNGFTKTYYSGEFSKNYVVKKGDLLITMDGEFKISRWNSEDALLNQRVCKIKVKGLDLLDEYLVYLLPKKLKEIEDKTPFVTVKHLSVKNIKEIKVSLPSLEEQKRIVQFLEKANHLRQKRKQSIGLLDNYIKSVFIEMFGDPLENGKRWDVKRLKDMSIKILSGNTPKGGTQVYVKEGVLFLRSQNVWRNRLELDDVAFISEETHNKMRNSSLEHKDLLMTKTGRFNTENSSLGRAAIYLGENNRANINGHVYLIRLKKDTVHEFVLFILTTNEYREYIRRICVGGIDKRQINKVHLEEFPIISPPNELQNKFSDIVHKTESIKQKMLLQSQELDIQFQALMQKSFSVN